jgi:thioredoxin reductase
VTAAAILNVQGVAELLDRGVHAGMPVELDAAIRDRDVVVAGDLPAAAVAALRLCAHGCRVCLVTGDSSRTTRLPASLRRELRVCSNITYRYLTEVSWAVGGEALEVVVLRHAASGRMDFCNATALFMLSSEVRLS